jgi:hypothetical protein
MAWGDPSLLQSAQRGNVVQLQRKGFYVADQVGTVIHAYVHGIRRIVSKHEADLKLVCFTVKLGWQLFLLVQTLSVATAGLQLGYKGSHQLSRNKHFS